jgi:hypothetical protein
MKRAGVPVGVGARFVYDGEVIEIVEMRTVHGVFEVLTRDLRAQTARRFALSELLNSDRAHLIVADGGPAPVDLIDVASVALSGVPDSARREARERAAHVREMLTGYRSGSPEAALPGEPRARYRPELPKRRRYAAKAKELKKGYRTIERWVRLYRDHGEAGLVSDRTVQPGMPTVIDRRWGNWKTTALEIMIEHTDLSKPTQTLVRNRANARLIRTGVDAARLPSPATANRLLKDLERQHPTFLKSAKLNRDIASRSVEPYGKLRPVRPGEYMFMDTTRLDVFAMDPESLRWVSVELTVVMDAYTRCITGMRLTPVSTKSIDAAAVLYQTFRPMPIGRDWPAEAAWPPHGVPRAVLIEKESLHPNGVLAATPAVVPETLIVDHGKIFVGDHLNSVCQRMGISIQPARLGEGRDKGPVERFFLTLRQGLLQELPGYKGPDLYSRGVAPEHEAFFYLDELEATIREWIAAVYHHRKHAGLIDPGLPRLTMTPAEMFEAGVARAGYIEAPRDPDLAYEFLEAEWRTVQHRGVEWNYRFYDGAVLKRYVGRKSPYSERGGLWPIHVNPDDIRQVYFRDPDTGLWHALQWEHAASLKMPMSQEATKFARELAAKKYRHFDDKLALAELLERRALGQGRSMAERRIDLRLAREQDSLAADLAAGSAAASAPSPGAKALSGEQTHEVVTWTGDLESDDESDEEPPCDVDEHYYDDIWDDV